MFYPDSIILPTATDILQQCQQLSRVERQATHALAGYETNCNKQTTP